MAMNRRQRARRAAAEHASGTRMSDRISARRAITLEIGEVVLCGIDANDRGALAAALEHELVLALGGETLRALRAGSRDRVDGGTISLDMNRGILPLGRQIAQAVERSLIEPTPEGKSSKR